MSKLHELLAINDGLKTTSIKLEKETMHTFVNKSSHFDGQVRTYQPRTEADETKPSENKPVVETVTKKLNYVLAHTIQAMNTAASIEATNQIANADFTLKGKIVCANVPVTVLVQFENKLNSIRDMFDHIPTLDPTQSWKATDSDILETEPKIVQSGKKVLVPVVLAPATDKHPAQIEKTFEDKVAGEWTTVLKSGRISPLEKSRMLARLDEVIRELKQARQRANSAEVAKMEFAEQIFEFILGHPIVQE